MVPGPQLDEARAIIHRSAIASGRDPDKILMEEFLHTYIVPEDFNLAAEEFAKSIQQKENIGYETSFSCRIITKQGWMRYISVKGKVVAEQMEFGIAQDITDAIKDFQSACSNATPTSNP